MPNRLVREGFLDSEAIHALSDAAECFFHRLMLTADDAGRMDGRLEILRARLFPLDISRRASDVEKHLAECVSQGLVIPYEWDGKPFLQLSKWQRCSPAKISKYPDSEGNFRIEYLKIETRDGEKEFVASSMAGRGGFNGGEPIRNPESYGPKGYQRDSEGIDKGCDLFVSGDGDGDGDDKSVGATGVPPAAPRRQPSVPVQAVVDVYNSTLTRLAKVRSITPKRKRAIEALWRDSPLAGDLDLFRQYFEECEADSFLSGAGPYRNGHENWRPDFDYLTRQDVVTKTYERAMDSIDRETRQ